MKLLPHPQINPLTIYNCSFKLWLKEFRNFSPLYCNNTSPRELPNQVTQFTIILMWTAYHIKVINHQQTFLIVTMLCDAPISWSWAAVFFQVHTGTGRKLRSGWIRVLEHPLCVEDSDLNSTFIIPFNSYNNPCRWPLLSPFSKMRAPDSEIGDMFTTHTQSRFKPMSSFSLMANCSTKDQVWGVLGRLVARYFESLSVRLTIWNCWHSTLFDWQKQQFHMAPEHCIPCRESISHPEILVSTVHCLHCLFVLVLPPAWLRLHLHLGCWLEQPVWCSGWSAGYLPGSLTWTIAFQNCLTYRCPLNNLPRLCHYILAAQTP